MLFVDLSIGLLEDNMYTTQALFALVSSAAVVRVITQRFSPTKLVDEKRCVMILITVAEETMFA